MATGMGFKTTVRKRLAIRARDKARERYWSEYDRDSHACWLCWDDDAPLDVHHADGDYLNNELLNLVALCHGCHRSIHRRQATRARINDWKAGFLDLGGDNSIGDMLLYSDKRQDSEATGD